MGKIVLCTCACECASLAVSMSEAISVSVCANVCVSCVIGGVAEGAEGENPQPRSWRKEGKEVRGLSRGKEKTCEVMGEHWSVSMSVLWICACF